MNAKQLVISDTRVVDEIPDGMKRLISMVVRAFHGPEHGLVVDYIKRNVCIKEDRLRVLLKLEQRHLRQLLMQLRMDKLVKERVVVEEIDGKSRKFNYCFINYRALVNVTKYKIDHMRQKLESREKDNTHRASYKCTGCRQHYDVMEVDKIYDPISQEMKCWRCNQLVEEDEMAGPSGTARSMLAKFNEQLTPLFAVLRPLDGVQLAPHLLEPPQPRDDPQMSDVQQSSKLGENGVVGRRATHVVGLDMYSQRGISINIEGLDANNTVVDNGDQSKELPVWLKESTVTNIGEETERASKAVSTEMCTSSVVKREESPRRDSDIVETMLEREMNKASEKMVANAVSSEGEDSDFEDVQDAEVTVQGRKFALSQVVGDQQLIGRMTDAERQHYIRVVQDQMNDHEIY